MKPKARIANLSENSVFEGLKSFMVLYHLYQLDNYTDVLFVSSTPQLHIPLEGLEGLQSQWLLFLLGWTLVISGILALFRVGGNKTLFVTGISGLFLLLLSTEGRRAFQYFPTFSILALCFAETRRTGFPLVGFLSILYVSAGLHKWINFELMLMDVPLKMDVLAPKVFKRLFGQQNLRILHEYFSYLIIPVEFLMGTLILFKTTRPFGFLLCALFHIMVGMFTEGIVTVSLQLLTVHACIATFGTDFKLNQLFASQKAQITWLIFLLSGISWSGLWDNDSLIVWTLQRFCLYAPPIFICSAIYFSSKKQEFVTLARPNTKRFSVLDLVWISIFLTWGLLPLFFSYRNPHLGWAVFSGGSKHLDRYCLISSKSKCSLISSLRTVPIIYMKHFDGQFVYSSTQRTSLQLLEKYLTNKCPSIPPPEPVHLCKNQMKNLPTY